ncbi:hypothetical protein JCM3775_006842 [Rhodotorula graminis]
MAEYLVQPFPYSDLQVRANNAARSFVEAGRRLRIDRSHEARLVAEAERWESAVVAEIDEPWWDKWRIRDQRSFLNDMRDLKTLYDRRPAQAGVPQHLKFSRIQIVEQIVHQIASSPPLDTDAGLWAQDTGDWFQLGFVELIKPADFHRADSRLRRRVVAEFERLDEHLLAHHEQGRISRLPALSDIEWFGALVTLLEENRVRLGVRKGAGLKLKDQSLAIANMLRGLPWWRAHLELQERPPSLQRPRGSTSSTLILKTLTDLRDGPYLSTQEAKFGDIMGLLDKLREEEDERSFSSSGRRCSVQSLGHGRSRYRR